jgi:thiol-disulfide isomerase/thioredoxin
MDFAAKFEAALEYEPYVRTGTAEQQRRWQQVYDAAALTVAQREMVGGFERELNLLVISGVWCGDCVQQVPLMQRIAEANHARVRLRIVDRDEHRDLAEAFRINGGDRVPVALLLSKDFELCSTYGDRTLHRYRAMAMQQLGAACPIALAAPDADELAATLADWLGEFERIHLMLRLSPRLRQRHRD